MKHYTAKQGKNKGKKKEKLSLTPTPHIHTQNTGGTDGYLSYQYESNRKMFMANKMITNGTVTASQIFCKMVVNFSNVSETRNTWVPRCKSTRKHRHKLCLQIM